MNLFPITLDIRGRKAVVVGGGAVAARKCRSLLEAGAAVTVIAPVITAELQRLHREGEISILPRPYLAGDLAGMILVFAATDNHAVNRAVAGEAKRLGILVCVADEPAEGNFASPSIVRRGDLLLTISTGGRSPALARRIRQDLEARYGPEYGDIVTIVGEFREKLLTEGRESAYNDQLFNELLNGDLTRFLNPIEQDRLFNSISNPDPERIPPPSDTEESS
jgi:precorrin-2 dehydrogenase/sirohydrochlorin ferrochelatase